MKIVFFGNPSFFGNKIIPQFTSMPRFTNMLIDGMSKRGHETEVWLPKPRFFNLPIKNSWKKWLGYIDQYIIFPIEVRKRLRYRDQGTLFVFTDQAQGPWIPIIGNRPHIIHCHDLLSQHSALNKIPENPISKSGKAYQLFIRKGLCKGKNFISNSYKTKKDLDFFLPTTPITSEVVYNGLNTLYKYHKRNEARALIGTKTGLDLSQGYILHVGGNLWYKNKIGIIELYNAWRSKYDNKLPLILLGENLSPELSKIYEVSPYKNDIHLVIGLEDSFVNLAYSGASVFLFPSLAEGFGWPIAEAMASGCPVITTNEAPMTEVAGESAFFIPRRPNTKIEIEAWIFDGAEAINKVVCLTSDELKENIEIGLRNVERFNLQTTLNTIEEIYKKVNDYDSRYSVDEIDNSLLSTTNLITK